MPPLLHPRKRNPGPVQSTVLLHTESLQERWGRAANSGNTWGQAQVEVFIITQQPAPGVSPLCLQSLLLEKEQLEQSMSCFCMDSRDRSLAERQRLHLSKTQIKNSMLFLQAVHPSAPDPRAGLWCLADLLQGWLSHSHSA